MIEESIKDFPKQFAFEPEIKNAEKLKPFESIVIGGMGGSGLIAGVLRALEPKLDVLAHHDYGLPVHIKKTNKHFFIASSYSGNTEETIDFFEEALKRNLNLAVMTTGGKLLARAKEATVPFIVLPNVTTQPRLALGVMWRGILKLIEKDDLSAELVALKNNLKPEELEQKGKDLAQNISNQTIVIYSSRRNLPIAYNWKVDFNEGTKIPAFYNVFPELNHNEMQGFDPVEKNRELSAKLHFIFIKDSEDHPRIIKRMEVTKELYQDRGLPVSIVELEGEDRARKLFNSLILGAWTAHYLAEYYKTDPEGVPMIEEFKKLI